MVVVILLFSFLFYWGFFWGFFFLGGGGLLLGCWGVGGGPEQVDGQEGSP